MMRALFPILLVGCLVACRNQPVEPAAPVLVPMSERLAKSWWLTDYTVQGRNNRDTMADEQKVKLLEAGVLFHFFPDGQWAFVEGELYHSGQWKLEEQNNRINCTYTDHDSTKNIVFKVRRLMPDTLIADLTRGAQTLSAKLTWDGRLYVPPEKCPWHPTNNDWRNKPDHAESNAEIKARAISHLRHYYQLLDASLTNTPHTMSIKNSPSCIQIYTSGIGVRSPEKIDAAWYATFYNRQDAEKCLQLYRKMMDEDGVLTGPKTQNWMRDDLTLLRRMLNNLLDEE